ncbi:MAG: Hydroxymethylpyrimidine/phosphomethylpyrimidine kinase [Pseudomonadota bacterium]|nr:Hydroxymethylpyrimidine/phosphomethylpyrimidine kinase [Pseudomonadota bacterium]
MNHTQRPVVVSFSGHDPSGGAGIQADIETIVSHRCHAASIITCLTAQNTANIAKVMPQKGEDIIKQADILLRDMPVHAFKIGLIGHIDVAQAIYEIIQKFPLIPVVLDPILAAGGGASLADTALIDAVRTLLLPLTTVLTPNFQEAKRLTQLDDATACGARLLDLGAEYVLVTGGDENTESVVNQLFSANYHESYTWARLPLHYHGSGCTLAASIASLLALGVAPIQAVNDAQEYTWHSLQSAYQTGGGQVNPNRLFWR